MQRSTLILPALSTLVLVGLLPDAASGRSFPVPRTGQPACYDAQIQHRNAIPCDIPKGDSLYGQDGQLQEGVAWPQPRFVTLVNKADDTGIGGGVAGNRICDGAERCNGVVKDQLTGLRWLANANCFGKVDWKSALQKAAELSHGQCGLRNGSQPGDWRLPNVQELQSLIDFGCVKPALSDRLGTGCFGADTNPVFSRLKLDFYWSSTQGFGSPGTQGFPWEVHLGGNDTINGYFTTQRPPWGGGGTSFVWPVRGGQ